MEKNWVSDMSNTASLPGIGHAFDVAVHRIMRSLGLGRRAREQRTTYIQLSRLSDHQLADIGLTRGLIETVVMQGPDSIRALQPDGAIQFAANNDEVRRIA